MEMVGDPDDLSSGIALNSAIFNLGRAIGPVLAGLLIASLGLWRGVSRQRAIVSGRHRRTVVDAPAACTPSHLHQPKMKAHLKEGLALSGPASHAAGADEPGRRFGLPVDAVHDADADLRRRSHWRQARSRSSNATCRFDDVPESGSRDLRLVDGRVWHRRAGRARCWPAPTAIAGAASC